MAIEANLSQQWQDWVDTEFAAEIQAELDEQAEIQCEREEWLARFGWED